MKNETLNEAGRAKRTDVGYKRPPIEHQFKPGHKPAARKKKSAPATVTQALMKILSEETRIERNGKPEWVTNAVLLVDVAFQLAEQGNPTLSRTLLDYLVASEKSAKPIDEPIILLDPDSDYHGVQHINRRVPI